MAARPRVVVVADDLGLSPGVNDGIAEAAAAGNVREASLLVTGGAVEHGLAAARAHGIGVGLHLSLTLGRALSGPIAGVTHADGRFRSLPKVLLACLVGRVDRDGIAREVDAQLVRLRELGVAPTHGNGHHHVHVFPVVREIAIAAFARHRVPWTRLPDELRAVRTGWSVAVPLLAHFARRARPLAERHGVGALPFCGLATEARTDFGARAARMFARLGDAGVSACEWMVHPRHNDNALRELDVEGYRRPSEDERQTLADRGLSARLGIDIVGYGTR